MKLRLLVPVIASLLLAGCATFSESELGQIRQRGVSQRVVAKIERGRVLTPQDVIELTYRGVPDRLIIRQIEDAGVDYVLSKEDYRRLQKARVSPAVLDALIAESDDFAGRYAAPRRVVSYGYYSDPYYYDDFYGPQYYPHGGVSVGVGIPLHHHWHRWH